MAKVKIPDSHTQRMMDGDWLSQRGWKTAGLDAYGRQLWSDPGGVGPRRTGTVAVETPSEEWGGVKRDVQHCVAPCGWTCVQEQAVEIQRERDAADGEDVQAKLIRLGAKLDKNAQATERLMNDLMEFLTNRPEPRDLDQHRAELLKIKRGVHEFILACKEELEAG